MIVGLDLSLNSTGMCPYDELTKEYKFLANVNMCAFTSKKVTPNFDDHFPNGHWLRTLADLPDVNIDFHKRPTGQGEGFIEIGQKRLMNVAELSAAHTTTLILDPFFQARQDSIIAIGIEDYSVAKITTAIVVVIETTAFLKQQYLLPFLKNNVGRFFTIPGPKLKQLAGNGNFNKFQLLMQFVEEEGEIRDTPFHKFCRENLKHIVSKSSVVEHPIDDMVDAYWVVKYTRDIIIGGGTIEKKIKLKKI